MTYHRKRWGRHLYSVDMLKLPGYPKMYLKLCKGFMSRLSGKVHLQSKSLLLYTVLANSQYCCSAVNSCYWKAFSKCSLGFHAAGSCNDCINVAKLEHINAKKHLNCSGFAF